MPPTSTERVRYDGLAARLKSRTSDASKVCVMPLAAILRPLVAMSISRSVVMATRTLGLDAVTKGSPTFGLLKGVVRVSHGIQR